MNRDSSESNSQVLSWVKLLAVVSLFVFILSALASAQSLGTITGTVADQTGAVVPKASVTLHNEGTGEKRDTVSNDSGYFSFASVTPGSYTIRVAVANFKTWERKGIPVRPGDVRDVAAVLQAGAASETVEVVGVADEVAPVDSGERSSVLTSKQIENLTLVGRDATELIRTLPGFAAYNGGGLSNKLASDPGIVALNGGGQVGTNYNGGGNIFRGGQDLTMDGAHILDNGCNCASTATVNGDMVAEVKVQTSNFGADSAKGPLVVNVIGKSGTTAYHGEAYFHARDESLNTLDWAFKHQMLTSPKGLVTPPASRFFFPGAQFGGPIPGTNKKLVFTTAFEYYYQNGIPLQGITVPGLLTNSVPTVSMRNGDFSTNGSNPSPGSSVPNHDNADLCAGLGYPSNWSPLCGDLGYSISGMDPGALALMSQVPMPNADPSKTGGFNLLVPEDTNQNGWMERTRVDYNLSDNTKIYGTYQIQKETDSIPVHLWWQPTNSIPFPGGMSTKDNSQTASGHFVKIISPTLTNDFSTALGYINFPLVKNTKSGWTKASMNYPYKEAFNNNTDWAPMVGNGYWLSGMPQMIQPDIFENGCQNGPCNAPFVWQKWNYSIEDNLTKAFKTHTVKVGFYWEKTTNNQGAFSDYNGHVEAAVGSPHNNPVANFLLGVVGYDQVSKYALDNLWYPTYSGYIQDDWKATKRLTLNLGLRADHLGDWRTPSSTGIGTFLGDPSKNPSGSAPGYSWHGLDSSIPLSGRSLSAITWEPRIGAAYDLFGTGKTVLRGGWGEYGYRDQWNFYQNPTDLAQGVRTYNPGTTTLAFIDSINGTIDPVGLGCGTANNPCGALAGLNAADHKQPITQSYNLTVSQQLPWSSLLEIGYVGSKTRNASLVGNTNNLDIRSINVIPLNGLVTLSGCTQLLSPTDANCDMNRKFGTGNNGVVNGATSAYTLGQFYGNAAATSTAHSGKANYNALQVSWLRQRGRLTYNLNYTWSKALGTLGTAQLTGSSPDGLNIANDYGILAIDRSHIFNFTYTYQVGNPVKGALGYVTNGWTLSGITTWQSGGNLTTSQDSGNNLHLGGNGPLSPILDGGGNQQGYSINPMNWVGTNNVLLQPTVTCDPTAHLHAHQYFNTACFGVSAPGQNGSMQLPYIHLPAYFNSDLALFKQFKITERQNVEFRISAFNFLNHALESFSGNGDNNLSINYVGTDGQGRACGAPGDNDSGGHQLYCPFGMGSWVPTTSSPTKPGGSVSQGYASTKFGRRVMEFSLKYTF